MRAIIGERALVALWSTFILILTGIGGAGMSAWKEMATDFQNGEFVNTTAAPEGLSLVKNNYTNDD